ncbi:hypothetical protein SAMN05216312_12245 [Cohnella sp. OV330]|nr:hypothetical protein SAMN05216312_12245 [Cohnella sp. OV330]
MFIHSDCKHRRRNIYTACEDLDFTWDLGDVHRVDELWKSGLSVEIIAKLAERPLSEVIMLVIDRQLLGAIHDRPNGFVGWREPNASERLKLEGTP